MIMYPDNLTDDFNIYDLSIELPKKHKDREWYQTFKHWIKCGRLGDYIKRFTQEHFGLKVVAIDYDGIYYLPCGNHTLVNRIYGSLDDYMIDHNICPGCGYVHPEAKAIDTSDFAITLSQMSTLL